MPAVLISPTPVAIERAAHLLRAGELVAFPTETVYGLGGDATSDRAVAAIFAAKGRPRFNPLIVHVPGLDEAEKLAHFDERARLAARRFWPGPLSLVLPRRAESGLSLLASAGLDTVALRAPAHPVAQALLRAARLPVAAPSANRSGRVSPTTAAHVTAELGDLVALILDGGACPIGIE
ncbi:MAG TPA: L-threonylcarbamoyladenylate synthase, partial [Stellaceae bacterium]|nr:L-threonylcarbamoyladenylate synthase [Stellaceae bacterium]